ncbi:MAG: TAXI family TRAP transporter solute-binding subunit [Alphaproteobacteria bacterium]
MKLKDIKGMLTPRSLMIAIGSASVVFSLFLIIASYGPQQSWRYIKDSLQLSADNLGKDIETDEDMLRFLRIYAGPPSEAAYAIATNISAGISRPPGSSPCDESGICGVPGLLAVAQSTAGSSDNIELLKDNPHDSVILPLDHGYFSYVGGGIYLGQSGQTDLRILSPLSPNALQIIVRQDSPIKRLRDLKYKRIAIGMPNSTHQKLVRTILNINGIKPSDFTAFELDDGKIIDYLLVDGVDAAFVLGTPPSRPIFELSQSLPLRLLSMDQNTLNQLKSLYPYFEITQLPAGIYQGVEQPTPTVEINLLWMVSKHLPNDTAEALAKALWQTKPNNLYFNDRANILLPDADIINKITLIPYHDGAKRYYDQAR